MLNRKKLNVAVAIALGTSAAALSTAQAGQLFFPQATVSNTVTTLFSVINTAGNKPGKPGEDLLHYMYYYKVKGAPTGNAEADEDAFNHQYCEEINTYLPTSKWDIQTIDIAGLLTEGVYGSDMGVMFNDKSVNNQWKQNGESFALAEFVDKPHRGYMVVEHANTIDGSSSAESLYGEAVVFEFTSGAAWGYQGFYKDGNDESARCNFRGTRSASPSHVAVFPFADSNFTTKFMVTPLWDPEDKNFDSCPGSTNSTGRNENYATVKLDAAYGIGNSTVVMFDRDENPLSGSTPKKVVCIGAVTAQYLVNDGIQERLKDGGWTGIRNYTDYTVQNKNGSTSNMREEPSAAIFKLEYGNTSALDPLSTGVYNNAIYLHPSFDWGVPAR